MIGSKGVVSVTKGLDIAEHMEDIRFINYYLKCKQ